VVRPERRNVDSRRADLKVFLGFLLDFLKGQETWAVPLLAIISLYIIYELETGENKTF